MICGLWFYHLTFCHVNPFCCILRRQQSSSKQFSVFLGGTLRLFRSLYFSALLVFGIVPGLHAQAGTASEPPRPLVLTEAIATPGVQGRFDHFGFDGKNQLFVAALGNNTVEVIDISARLRSHTITGIPNPQGVVYAPDAKKLFVASSKGKLRIYCGENMLLLEGIGFFGGVDKFRSDPATPPGFGGFCGDEGGAGGLGGATSDKRLPEENKLGAQP